MKVVVKDIEKILSAPTKHGILIYGSNSGKALSYYNALKNSLFPEIHEQESCIVTLQYNDIKSRTSVLYEQLYNLSLTKKKTLIKVINLTEHITNEMKDILNSYNGSNYVIFIGSELSSQSNLRQLFEKSNNLLSIACYHEDERTKAHNIRQFFYKNKIKYTDDVVKFMTENIQGDSLLLQNELEKIRLYSLHTGCIDLDAVSAIVRSNNDHHYNEMAIAFMDCDINRFFKIVHKMLSSGTYIGSIIRAISNYMTRLYKVIAMQQNTSSQTEAISSLKPPVFFKYKDDFVRHVNMYDITAISRISKKLLEIDILCKQNNNNFDIFAYYMINCISIIRRSTHKMQRNDCQ